MEKEIPNEENVEEEASSSEEVEETKEESTDDNFDYKSEYEKLAKSTEKKDYAFEKLRKEKKGLKEKLAQFEEDTGEEPDQADIQDIINKNFSELRKELLGDKTQQEVETYTQDPYAQKLVNAYMEKYQGMPVKEAWMLANSGRLEKTLSELNRAKDSNNRKGDGSGAGQKDNKSNTAPELSPDNLKIIKRMGLKWDGEKYAKKDGRFALKIVNGSIQKVDNK